MCVCVCVYVRVCVYIYIYIYIFINRYAPTLTPRSLTSWQERSCSPARPWSDSWRFGAGSGSAGCGTLRCNL